MELKEADLLHWCNKFTKGHDHITPASDLNKCWEDGTLFCALLYNWYPKKIPIHALLVRETRDDKLSTLHLAFTVGEDSGIPPLLEAERVVDGPAENAKLIPQYLKSLHDALAAKPTKYQYSLTWLKKFEEEEKARKLLELTQRNLLIGQSYDRIDRKATAVGPNSLLAAKLGTEQLLLLQHETSILERQEEERLRARARALIYEAEPNEEVEIQRAREKARKKIRESLEEKEKEKERERQEQQAQSLPSAGDALEDATAVEYQITGKGVAGGVVGKLCVFTVNFTIGGKKPFDSSKTDLHCALEGPSRKCHIMVSGGISGSFHVGFTPDQPGQHWIDFRLKDEWAAQPYCLKIIGGTGNSCPDYPYTGKEKLEGATGDDGAKDSIDDSHIGEKDEREKETDSEREKLLQKIQSLEKEIQAALELTSAEQAALKAQARASASDTLYLALDSIEYTLQADNDLKLSVTINKKEVSLNGQDSYEALQSHEEPVRKGEGVVHVVQQVIENENEADVKYQLPESVNATLEWTALPGFPVKFTHRSYPSLDTRADQAFQVLVDEAKHKKEKDIEPLRKELSALLQRKRDEDRVYFLERKKQASNSQVYMWEKLSQENNTAKAPLPSSTGPRPNVLSTPTSGGGTSKLLGQWETKQTGK